MLFRSHIDPLSIAHALERLGINSGLAEKLRVKLPQTKNIRSGDLGRMHWPRYVRYTDYIVPIKKLRWCDLREMLIEEG